MIITDDGSPTLAWTSATGRTECMHSRHGALSESLYIYDEALKIMTEKKWPLRILSMGLGLGYNEIILAARILSHRIQSTHLRLESFEKQTFLSENLKLWISGGEASKGLASAYTTIVEKVAQHFDIDPNSIKKTLQHWLEQNQWLLRSALTSETSFEKPFTVILYDAYSSHTDPELWHQSYLCEFLTKAASSTCVFATYAATGDLKRALKQQAFDVDLRPGFAGKRQSTLAIRE